MDNNPTEQQTQPAGAVQDPVVTPASQTVPPGPGEGNNKMALWLVVGLVVIILVVGGIYWFMSKQQSVSQPNTTPAPASQSQENLENDINSVSVSDVDAEFSAVDSDLQAL